LGTGKREMKLTPKRILIKSQLEPIVAVEYTFIICSLRM